MNRAMYWLISAAAASSLFVASFTGSGSAGEGTRAALAGKTVITGSEMSYIPVSIAEPVTLSIKLKQRSVRGPTADITVQGAGRLVGVVLVTDPPPASLTKDFIVAGRFARCSLPGCDPGNDAINFHYPTQDSPTRHRLRLSPGDYRLYLLADGEPVRVVLKLHGLRGSTSIHPSMPAPADLGDPQETAASAALDNHFAAGGTHRAGDKGMILSTLWARAQSAQDYVFGTCHQSDPSPLPAESVYGPQCEALAAITGGLTHVGFSRAERGFDQTLLSQYTESPSPDTGGNVGFGGWISANGPIERAGFHGLFLSWDVDS